MTKDAALFHMTKDAAWMEMAIGLAKNGTGAVNPNPLVGAVLVRDGQCIGSGWHQRYGEAHAERNALADCKRRGNDPAGATLYVTLEPCCHYGKTPPCTQAIIENRLKKVFIGSRDPNPLVSGKGVQALRDAGIEVVTDFLREECDQLNTVFFHYITTGTPYVVLKYAMTMDGKIATVTGASQWITGPEARAQVHRDRNRLMAIMTGVGTVLADDPLLTCRLPASANTTAAELTCRLPAGEAAAATVAKVSGSEAEAPAHGKTTCQAACDAAECESLPAGEATAAATAAPPTHGRNPVRIICDTNLRTPLTAQVVTTTDQARTILATAVEDPQRHQPYRDAGCEILVTPRDADGHLDLPALMKLLAAQSIDSILLEGGSTLNWAALSGGIVQQVQTYLAPKLFGGAAAPSPVGGPGVNLPGEAFLLHPVRITPFGDDLLIESEVRPCSQASSKKSASSRP